MKLPLLLAALLACASAQATCPMTVPLKGFIAVDNCDPSKAKCVPAGQALHQYTEAQKDDDPAELSIALHGSPWRIYHGDWHILEIEELADMVRQRGNKFKRVALYASWSGVAPDRNSKSVAQKLSAALNGMPVSGKDGFVWYAKDGAMSTTQQAFTGVMSGPYSVAPGQKVMASLVVGWAAALEPEYAKRRDAEGLMRAGVASDVYMLCPERALKAFDAAAQLSDPIAAYNAALMRLDRGGAGDAQAAVALLRKSAAAGDRYAQAKLKKLAKAAP